MTNTPKLIDALWGIWIPDGGPDSEGCWMQHESEFGGPMAFESLEDAKGHAEYEKTDFSNAFAAPMTHAAHARDGYREDVLHTGGDPT